jgi:hypothetical protein
MKGMRMKAKTMRLLKAGSVAGLLVLSVTGAQAAHLDVFVANNGGQVGVAGFDFLLTEIDQTVVFESELENTGQFAGAEPGFTSGDPDPSTMPAGWTPLGAGLDVSFGILAEPTLGLNLLYWDGQDANADLVIDVADVSFGAVPDLEVMLLQETGCFVCASATADGSASGVSGFVIDTTDVTGTIHRHLNFFLLGDSVASDLATEGVYLMALQMAVTGLVAADPLWIVFGAFDSLTDPEIEERLEAAAGYVSAFLVPEPSALAMLALGVLGLARFGARRWE